jgi:hypothetical protein
MIEDDQSDSLKDLIPHLTKRPVLKVTIATTTSSLLLLPQHAADEFKRCQNPTNRNFTPNSIPKRTEKKNIAVFLSILTILSNATPFIAFDAIKQATPMAQEMILLKSLAVQRVKERVFCSVRTVLCPVTTIVCLL